MTYKPDKIRLKCLLIAQTTDWIKNALHQSKRDLRFTISLTDSHNVALIFSCVILVQFKSDCFIRDILIARSEIAQGERLVRAQLLFVVGVWWWRGRGDVLNSWGTFYSQSLNPCCLLFIVNIHHVTNLEHSLLKPITLIITSPNSIVTSPGMLKCHVTQLPLRGGFWWFHVKICLFPP